MGNDTFILASSPGQDITALSELPYTNGQSDVRKDAYPRKGWSRAEMARMARDKYTGVPSSPLALNIARYSRAIIFTVFNPETMFILGLAMLSTYSSSIHAWNVRYRLDSFSISLAIISPLMYTLRAAFLRRENAAKSMAALKSACLAYYLTMRDWNRVPKGNMAYVGDNQSRHAQEVYSVVHRFLQCVVRYVRYGMGNHESLAEVYIGHHTAKNWFFTMFQSKLNFDAIDRYHYEEKAELVREHVEVLQEDLNRCYQALSELNMWNERTLVSWGHERPGDAAISSRSNDHLRHIITSFESLRLAREYRTPVMLRYGCRVLIYVYAIFMGPYFNGTCDSFEDFERQKFVETQNTEVMHPHLAGYEPPTCFVNYISTILFFLSVTLIARSARDVEFPFQKQGLDDLFLDTDQELESFTRLPGDKEFKKRVMEVVVEPSLDKDRNKNGKNSKNNEGKDRKKKSNAGPENTEKQEKEDQGPVAAHNAGQQPVSESLEVRVMDDKAVGQAINSNAAPRPGRDSFLLQSSDLNRSMRYRALKVHLMAASMKGAYHPLEAM